MTEKQELQLRKKATIMCTQILLEIKPYPSISEAQIAELFDYAEEKVLYDNSTNDSLKTSILHVFFHNSQYTKMQSNKAYLLFIPATGRFFYDYKNKRVCTAWCLAGAKLFSNLTDIEAIEKILNDRKIVFQRKEITVDIN